MNYIRPSLYARLLGVLSKNPELQKYRSQLIKSCCRPPPESVLRSRLLHFMLQHPELKTLLEGILYPKVGGCH